MTNFVLFLSIVFFNLAVAILNLCLKWIIFNTKKGKQYIKFYTGGIVTNSKNGDNVLCFIPLVNICLFISLLIVSFEILGFKEGD